MSELLFKTDREGTRGALRAITRAIGYDPLTQLIRFHCTHVRWRGGEGDRVMLTFIMDNPDNARDVSRFLTPPRIQTIGQLVKDQLDLTLSNATAATINQP